MRTLLWPFTTFTLASKAVAYRARIIILHLRAWHEEGIQVREYQVGNRTRWHLRSGPECLHWPTSTGVHRDISPLFGTVVPFLKKPQPVCFNHQVTLTSVVIVRLVRDCQLYVTGHPGSSIICIPSQSLYQGDQYTPLSYSTIEHLEPGLLILFLTVIYLTLVFFFFLTQMVIKNISLHVILCMCKMRIFTWLWMSD